MAFALSSFMHGYLTDRLLRLILQVAERLEIS
jgi:hypothetical protein